MDYIRFSIENYRAIKGPMIVDLRSRSLLPLIGLNECGKTTILQAIFAFDYLNDDEYQSRHIKDVLNLYNTNNVTASVSAVVRGSAKNWKDLLAYFVNQQTNAIKKGKGELEAVLSEDELEDDVTYVSWLKAERDLYQWEESIRSLVEKSSGDLEIVRNLNSLEYKIRGSGGPENMEHLFCEEVLSETPFILYNDDFQDRPPSKISIPKAKRGASGWLLIYEKLFSETNPSYSLRATAEIEDPRRRESIVSDVQAVLNKTLAKAWRSFHLDRNKKIKVRLALSQATETSDAFLNISIVENIGEHERFFEVVDRSKGFLWFYNFVMKTEFNPKDQGGKNNTIYLLDEPGSYLHSAAQIKLCEKLRSISRKRGKIVYCTHSPHLLDPNSIPLNDVHIVTKNSKKEISITRLPLYHTEGEKITALQPLFEALQINGQQFMDSDRPMLAVEGIYDKYAIALFMDGSENYHILPGASANSIVKNIQFLNAFGKKYVALWDNDKEGRKEYGRALDSYGPQEGRRFILLPAPDGESRRMESMFSDEDHKFMRDVAGLESHSSYESALGEIFFGEEALKKRAKEGMSQFCRESFGELATNIARLL